MAIFSIANCWHKFPEGSHRKLHFSWVVGWSMVHHLLWSSDKCRGIAGVWNTRGILGGIIYDISVIRNTHPFTELLKITKRAFQLRAPVGMGTCSNRYPVWPCFDFFLASPNLCWHQSISPSSWSERLLLLEKDVKGHNDKWNRLQAVQMFDMPSVGHPSQHSFIW